MMNIEQIAFTYHKNLIKNKPFGIYEYLKIDRGFSDKIIKKFWIGFDEKRNCISIPIYDKNFDIVDIKFRYFSGDSKYKHLKGGKLEIYGWENLLNKNEFVFCEGPFDRLILEEKGIFAITTTGGAGAFKEEWIPYFKDKIVYFFFDNDSAGKKGVEKIFSHIKNEVKCSFNIIPSCLKEKEDATDYFVKYGKTRLDFEEEMESAKELKEVQKEETKTISKPEKEFIAGKSIDRKDLFILDTFDFIPRTLKVKSYGNPLMAICPFHKDRTPSFAIYENNWYCFSCKAKGRGNIEFVMKLMNINYEKAVKYLKNFYNFSAIKNNGFFSRKSNPDTS